MHNKTVNTGVWLRSALDGVAILCMLLIALRVSAQVERAPVAVGTDTVRYVRVNTTRTAFIAYPQGDEHIEVDFQQNAEELAKIAALLDKIRNTPTAHLLNIHLAAYASIEGTYQHNLGLSYRRAESLKQYLQQALNINPELISTEGGGEDWKELTKLIEADHSELLAPFKQQVLDIIRTVPIIYGRETQIMKLDNGNVYRYLSDVYFPKLRRTVYDILWSADSLYVLQSEFNKDIVRDTIVRHVTVTVTDTVHKIQVVADTIGAWMWRTNLLGDAILIPNIGVEYRFAEHWSVAIGGYWMWLQTKAPQYWSYRVQALGAELRYWLRYNTKRTGHSFGLYGAAGTYDIRIFPRSLLAIGYLSPFSYTAGVSYNYRWRLRQHWYMECSIGLGYFAGRYLKYHRSDCDDCYIRQEPFQRRFFGPTRIALSLIYTPKDKE